MKKYLATAAIYLATLAANPALSQVETTADTVLATVDGVEITAGHLILARAELPSQYRQLPMSMIYPSLLDQLIQMQLLKTSFEGEVPPNVRYGVENEERTLIASIVIARLLASNITDEMIEAAYLTRYADQDLGVEYDASHILVDTEDEALSILDELNAGADFVTAAQTYSTGPSGPGGGSLGWFGRGDMVQPFDEAVAAMEVGTLSDPVQTQFGWHIIRLNDTRMIEAPELEEVREDIIDELGQAVLEGRLAELEAGAVIEQTDTADIDFTQFDDPAILDQ